MINISGKPVCPALDDGKPLSNPDLPSIGNRNYTDTILKYAGLATKFPQLKTKSKTLVGAINEIENSSGDAGAPNTVRITLMPSRWEQPNPIMHRWYYYLNDVPEVLKSAGKVMFYPLSVYKEAGHFDHQGYREWYNCGIEVGYSSHALYEFRAYRQPQINIILLAFCWPKVGGSYIEDVACNAARCCSVYDVTLYADHWNTSTHIYQLGFDEVTINSDQTILPIPVTNSDDLSNNIALQEANLQDAGQSVGLIKLYAENVPARDLRIRIMFNG